MIFISIPIPLFVNILGPFVVWILKKDQSEFIDLNGKESLNFQISITIYTIVLGIILGIIAAILLVVGVITTGFEQEPSPLIAGGVSFIILIVLAIVIGLFQVILALYASIKAYQGQLYRYPLTIRFLRTTR